MKKLIKKITFWIKKLFLRKNKLTEIKEENVYVLKNNRPPDTIFSNRDKKSTNNRKQTKGRNYYFQTIVDKKTGISKTIKHIRE
jgi:hypothetical protein